MRLGPREFMSMPCPHCGQMISINMEWLSESNPPIPTKKGTFLISCLKKGQIKVLRDTP